MGDDDFVSFVRGVGGRVSDDLEVVLAGWNVDLFRVGSSFDKDDRTRGCSCDGGLDRLVFGGGRFSYDNGAGRWCRYCKDGGREERGEGGGEAHGEYVCWSL